MNRQRLAKLRRIYAKIPGVKCKGLCTDTCGSIGLSQGEFIHLTKITREKPSVVDFDRCNYLKDERCSVYDDRPSVCRLFGVVDVMKCPHGCEVERVLAEPEARKIMDEISKLFNEMPRTYITND